MPTPRIHRVDQLKPEVSAPALDTPLMDQLLASLDEFLLAMRQQAHALKMLQQLNDLAEQSPAVAHAIDREVDVMLVQSLVEGNRRREVKWGIRKARRSKGEE